MTVDPAITLAFSFALAGLLAASAAHKFGAWSAFVGVVRNYEVAPSGAAALIAVLAVSAEIALAAGFLAPATRGFAAFGAASLFAVYAGAIGLNLMRGRAAIDCGCSFGGAAGRLSPLLVYRNAALAAFAFVAAAPVSTRSLNLIDFITVSLFCVTAAALYLAFESLQANAARFHAAERAR